MGGRGLGRPRTAGGKNLSSPQKEELLARLEESGLVEALPGGSLRFAHGALREILLERAEIAGRLPAHHAACARVIPPSDLERAGRHLLLAGEIDAAAPLFERAAAEALDLGQQHRSLAILDGWTAAPTPGQLLARAEALMMTMAQDPGLELLLARLAAPEIPARVRAGAGVVRARRLDRLGQLAASRDEFLAIEAEVRALGDLSLIGDWHYGLAWPLLRLGQPAASAEHLDAASRAWAAAGRRAALLRAELGRAVVLSRSGALDEAEVAARQAWEQAERAGRISAALSAANCLGEIARERRDFDEAVRFYRAAMALHRTIRPGTSCLAEANLGAVLLEQGRAAEARRHIEAVLDYQLRKGVPAIATIVRVYLARCAAQSGDYAEFQAHLAEIGLSLAGSAQVEPELAQALEGAAADAQAQGWAEEAAALADLARDQRRRME